jgi:hypothetical protein
MSSKVSKDLRISLSTKPARPQAIPQPLITRFRHTEHGTQRAVYETTFLIDKEFPATQTTENRHPA